MSKKTQFLIVFLAFIILGACFKVMVLVEGFTEVRPVNAIPVPAGLLFGPIGGLACACGNLVADFFGTLAWSSSLGFIGNFAAAYLPYKLWYLFYDERPNLHGVKKIVCYIWISLIAALAVSWMIATGLWLIFQLHIENMGLYIILNDFVFAVIFGIPVFSVVTSDDVGMVGAPPIPDRIKLSKRAKRICMAAYNAILIPLCYWTWLGADNLKLLTGLLSVPAVILTVILML